MRERPSYIGKNRQGISEKLFSAPTFQGNIESLSRNGDLYGHLTPKNLAIGVHGENDPKDYRLNIYIDSQTLFMNIYNKGLHNRGERHPDIHAKALVKRFIEHAAENNEPIKTIQGIWNFSSDNYFQFYEYLERIQSLREPSDNDALAAARSTWTGQLATSLGYDKVRINNEWRKAYEVEASFSYGSFVPIDLV